MTLQLDDDNRLIIGKGVRLKPYRQRPFVDREIMTEAEIYKSAGGDLILDVESYPNYFLAGFKHVQSGKYIFLEKDFNPRFLSWLLHSFRTVGFNSIYYDLIVLWAAYVNRDPGFLKQVTNDIIVYGKPKREVEREYGFKCYPLEPRQHVDLINVCPLTGSLKLYAARLHCKRIQDLPFPDTEYLEDWQKDVVRDYNGNDLDNTDIIAKFCKERLALRESLSIKYGEDLMSKSDAQMAEVVIPKEVAKLNGKWPKRPTIEPGTAYKYSVPSYIKFVTPQLQELLYKIKKADFVVQDNGYIALPKELDGATVSINGTSFAIGIGGLHSQEKEIGYESDEENQLSDRDMVSFYPNILINGKLYPIALGPNFLIVFKGFKDQRVVAKRNKNFTEDKGLKIFINGMSGKLSDVWSKMRSPDLTIQMTITGQLTLLLFAEILTCNGFKVISANTDGIVIYHKRADQEKLLYWVKYFEQLTGFETENTEYASYYARDVNAYFAVKTDGGVKVKGPYSEVGSQSGTQLDTNPITLICSDAIKLFLSKKVPFEETILNCKDITRFVTVRQVKGGAHKDGEYLGKVVRWYYAKGEYGTINYVMNGNKVPETEGAKPAMDLPDSFPNDVNYAWYIDKCKNILYDIGFSKRAKQVAFW
jgi:hypothetical protein